MVVVVKTLSFSEPRRAVRHLSLLLTLVLFSSGCGGSGSSGSAGSTGSLTLRAVWERVTRGGAAAFEGTSEIPANVTTVEVRVSDSSGETFRQYVFNPGPGNRSVVIVGLQPGTATVQVLGYDLSFTSPDTPGTPPAEALAVLTAYPNFPPAYASDEIAVDIRRDEITDAGTVELFGSAYPTDFDPGLLAVGQSPLTTIRLAVRSDIGPIVVASVNLRVDGLAVIIDGQTAAGARLDDCEGDDPLQLCLSYDSPEPLPANSSIAVTVSAAAIAGPDDLRGFGDFTYSFRTGDLPPVTPTAVGTATPTSTLAPSATSTETPVPTETATATVAPTDSHTPTVSASPTDTETPEPSATASSSPTETEVPTDTPSPSPTATLTETATPTDTETPTETETPVATDTAEPTFTPTATATPDGSSTPDPDDRSVVMLIDVEDPAPGDTVTLTLILSESDGSPVGSESCTIEIDSQPGTDGSVDPGEVTTDAFGVATTSLTLASVGGSTKIKATCGSIGSFIIILTEGGEAPAEPPASLPNSGEGGIFGAAGGRGTSLAALLGGLGLVFIGTGFAARRRVAQFVPRMRPR